MAAFYGTFAFMGASGRIYNVDAYFSDTVDGLVRFDGGAGASSTSPDSFNAPEPVVLIDMAVASGASSTTKIQLLRNNQPTGDFLRYSLHSASNSIRPPLRIGFRPGTEIRAIQKA